LRWSKFSKTGRRVAPTVVDAVTTWAQLTVEGLIGQGAPFESIEEYTETLPLPSEQLGALWLLAWAEATDPATRRLVVAELLGAPRDRPGGRPPRLRRVARCVRVSSSVGSFFLGTVAPVPNAAAGSVVGEMDG
jgi:hypothetical protein